jgi:hypothetical protein
MAERNMKVSYDKIWCQNHPIPSGHRIHLTRDNIIRYILTENYINSSTPNALLDVFSPFIRISTIEQKTLVVDNGDFLGLPEPCKFVEIIELKFCLRAISP